MKKSGILIILSVALTSVFGQDKVTDLEFNKYPRGPSSAESLSLIHSPELLPVIYLGNYSIVRSTLGAGGASNTVVTDEGTYYISSSIGQASTIGTFNKSGYSLRQGFQQPFGSVTPVKSQFMNTLSAKLYPNPFSHSVTVSIGEIADEDLYIEIYDMKGRMILSEKHPPSKLIILPLKEIFDGIYILRITLGNKHYRAQLIKQYQ